MSKQSKRLFEEMELVGDYPKGIVPVPEQLTCTAFFPGGYGLWQEDGAGNHLNWPSGGIMVLGHYCPVISRAMATGYANHLFRVGYRMS
jgi:hypothetical protein